MFSQSLRTQAIACLPALLVSGCLSSSPHDSAFDDYSRITAPSKRSGPGVSEAALESGTLLLGPLVAQVLARNPSIEMAREGWRGALAQYTEATAYGDTQLTYTVAPLSVLSSSVKFGQGIQVSQALPYPGKRKLRGEIVLAEAEAKREGYQAVRRRLGLMTARLYYDYFLVGRALTINGEHQRLLARHLTAVTMYMSTGKAWLEDAAEVRVAAAELKQQNIALASQRDVLVAQLNALLHRRAAAPVPAPPKELAAPTSSVGEFSALHDEAVAARPELRAVGHQITAAKGAVALAKKDFYPDFRVIGSYNGMWASIEHQLMVGVSVNLPVQRARRKGAVQRSQASLRSVRAGQAILRDQIGSEVQTARLRALAADEIVKAYRDDILPAARSRIVANSAGLPTGRTNFVEVIRAETGLKLLEFKYASAIASAYRYRADLAAAIGRVPGLASEGGVR